MGEILAFDLMTNLLTGERLTGYLTLQPVLSVSAFSAEVKQLSDSELRDLESRLRDAGRDVRKQIDEQFTLLLRSTPALR